MKTKHIIVSGLVCMVGVGTVVGLLLLQKPQSIQGQTPSEIKKSLVGGIEQHGAGSTYALFKDYAYALPYERQHMSAHIMGEALFESLGTSGFTACDADFGFGCYHGFFGRAIAREGESLVKELDTVCVETFGPLGTGCQHGLGHGILEYVGYDNINEALALCGYTTQLVPLLGCTSGVFMEYLTPLVGVGETFAKEVRPFNERDPFDPCTSVATAFQSSCYYELGSWLPITLGDAAEGGKVCEQLLGEKRVHCFLGIGSITTYLNNYSSEQSLSLCASFGGEDERACRAGVSWALFSTPEYRSASADACRYTREEDTLACLALADFTHGL